MAVTPKSPALALLTPLWLANLVSAANILCLLGVASDSARIWNRGLLGKLADNGHNLTVVSSEVWDERAANVHFIRLEKAVGFPGKPSKARDDSFLRLPSAVEAIFDWYDQAMATCRANIESQGFNEALQLATEQSHHYDFIVYDITYGLHCLSRIAVLYANVPLVGVSSSHLIPDVLESTHGGLAKPATVPYFLSGLPEAMTCWERWYNTALYAIDYIYRHWVVHPVLEGMQPRGEQKTIKSSTAELVRLTERLKIALVNTHPALDTVQPSTPNIVPVGGLHIEQPQPLPTDIQQFIARFPQGTIFVSLHSAVLDQEQLVSIILPVIERLPAYAFLWKTKANRLLGRKPKNLIVDPKLVQRDILASGSTKVFVTSAGNLDVQEAVYSGVPVIALPSEGPQRHNARRAVERGFGITLDIRDLSSESLFDAFTTCLNTKSYSEGVRRTRLAFRKRPMGAMETALWWLEAVLENPELYNRSSHSAEMGFVVQHSLDFISLMALFVLLLLVNSFVVIQQTLKHFRILDRGRSCKTKKSTNNSKRKVKIKSS